MIKYTMGRVLITGSNGFIGSHLMKKLEDEGWDVVGLDNNFHQSKAPEHKNTIVGDIRNKQLVDDLVKNVDVVYHLAAVIHVDYSIKYPEDTLDVNVGGTLNILEACRKYKKKLVFASTSEVYGSSQSDYMTEEHQLDAQSPYGASKVAGDRLCKSYIDTYGMNITILRNFNTFGEWQNDGSYGGVIAIFTRQALNGDDITIFGDGSQERDYMYIDDAIQAYIIASKTFGVMNAGTGKTVTINEIANLIKKITKSNSKIVYKEPRAGEVMRLCAGIDKATNLGFNPNTNFKEHLTKYIKWYERNIFNKDSRE